MKKQAIIFLIILILIFVFNYNIVWANSYVVKGVTNIYAEKNGEIIGTLKKGYVIEEKNIINKEKNWIKIKINSKVISLNTWLKTTDLSQINQSTSLLDNNNFEFSNIQYKNQPGIGLITFIGNIHNISNQNYNIVTFIFTVFDSNNKKVDSTIVKINNINADEKKYFSGHLYTTLNKVDHYNIKFKEKK